MKTLITGASGFVGKHLVDELQSIGHEVVGIGTSESSLKDKIKYFQMNILDKSAITNLINELKPTYIFHLAGISNIKYSWENKEKTFEANIIGTTILLDAIKECSPYSKILTIGSSEEYGPKSIEKNPLSEDSSLEPINPYGISKAAISMLIRQYQKVYGLEIIHARPFNHIGIGQSKGFVVPDFAEQIIDIEKGKKERFIKVGNLSATRDFTDVRDIIKAYISLMGKGESGQIYNVCSGVGVSIDNILNLLIKLSRVDVEIVRDPNLSRPSDIPVYVGDNSKLKRKTEWEPLIAIEETLNDILMNLRDC